MYVCMCMYVCTYEGYPGRWTVDSPAAHGDYTFDLSAPDEIENERVSSPQPFRRQLQLAQPVRLMHIHPCINVCMYVYIFMYVCMYNLMNGGPSGCMYVCMYTIMSGAPIGYCFD